MTVKLTKQCAACERTLPPEELYFRFAVAVEGEQDHVGEGDRASTKAELDALVAQLDASHEDAQHWEDQVHWERAGVICAQCRDRLVHLLGGSREPH